MFAIPQRLCDPAQLGTSATPYVTAQANTNIQLLKVTFLNNSASARTVTAHIVKSGGSAGSSNAIIVTATIPAYKSWDAPSLAGHALNPGDTLQALADSGSAVVIHATGFVIQ